MPESPEALRVSIDPWLPEHHARGIWRALNEAPEAVGRSGAEDRPARRRVGHVLGLLGLCGVGVSQWLLSDLIHIIATVIGIGLAVLHLRHRYRRKADEAEASIDPRATIAFFEGSFVVDVMLDDIDRARLGRIQRVSEVLLDQGRDLRWVAETEWALAVRLPALTLDRVRAERCSREGERERRKAETSAHEAVGHVPRILTLLRVAPVAPSRRSHQSTAKPGLTPSSALCRHHWMRRSRRAASTENALVDGWLSSLEETAGLRPAPGTPV